MPVFAKQTQTSVAASLQQPQRVGQLIGAPRRSENRGAARQRRARQATPNQIKVIARRRTFCRAAARSVSFDPN
jgi:hypothetical protein